MNKYFNLLLFSVLSNMQHVNKKFYYSHNQLSYLAFHKNIALNKKKKMYLYKIVGTTFISRNQKRKYKKENLISSSSFKLKNEINFKFYYSWYLKHLVLFYFYFYLLRKVFNFNHHKYACKNLIYNLCLFLLYRENYISFVINAVQFSLQI